MLRWFVVTGGSGERCWLDGSREEVCGLIGGRMGIDPEGDLESGGARGKDGTALLDFRVG